MFKEKFEIFKKEFNEHKLITKEKYKKSIFFRSLNDMFVYIWHILIPINVVLSLLSFVKMIPPYITYSSMFLLCVTYLISKLMEGKYEKYLSESNKNDSKDWLKDFNFNEEEILENIEVIIEMESSVNVLNKYFSKNINFFISNIKEIHQKILKNNDINVFLRIMDFDYEEKKLILLSKDIEWLAEVIGNKSLYDEMYFTIDNIMLEKETKYYEIIKSLFYDFLEDAEDKEEINNFIELKNQIRKEIQNEKLEIKKEITIINI